MAIFSVVLLLKNIAETCVVFFIATFIVTVFCALSMFKSIQSVLSIAIIILIGLEIHITNIKYNQFSNKKAIVLCMMLSSKM